MSAIIRRIDPGDSIFMQFIYLIRQNSATTTTKYFYVPAAIFIQQVFHVFKKFNMTALVTGNGNPLHIFLDCCFYNLFN